MSGEETTTPSDEEMRKLWKPNPTPAQVVEALQNGYDKTVKIVKELDSYDDVNYLVQDCNDGTEYLAKIHNGVESLEYVKNAKDSSIFFQNALMQHLNQHDIPTSSPIKVSSADKSLPLASLPVVSGPAQDLVVRLLSWVPGRPMSSVPFLPMESLVDAGRFLGNLDSKLDIMTESCAAADRHHAWDGKNTLEVREYTKFIPDEQRRGMVESILDAFQRDIIDKKVEFRTGILQADFNDANILVDNDLTVSGVIDFGDSVRSWRVLDISVAMAYSMMSAYGKNGRSISAASSMLRGYNSVYRLQDVEREHLHLLMTCRLACSATLGAYSYQQNPENEYLLLHAEPAWKTLELVWGYDEERRVAIKAAVNRMFDKACSNGGGVPDYYCCDLALPDPFIVDVRSSVRDTDDTRPAAKRQKTDGTKPVITFVTGNKKKLEEVKRIMGDDGNDGATTKLPFVITNRKVDLPELQGDPIDIARNKCSAAARQVGGAVITEDTSLCFTALKGLPGPYIKWFLDGLGHDGLNNLIASSNDKSAYAQTLVAFCPGPGKDVVVFDGRTMGKIVPARGSLAFGWDPIFKPDEGGGLTYAEMTKEAKDAISHRSRAFSQLRDYFIKENEAISSQIL